MLKAANVVEIACYNKRPNNIVVKQFQLIYLFTHNERFILYFETIFITIFAKAKTAQIKMFAF